MKHFLGEIFKDESDVMVPIFKKSRGHRTDWVQKFRDVFVIRILSFSDVGARLDIKEICH